MNYIKLEGNVNTPSDSNSITGTVQECIQSCKEIPYCIGFSRSNNVTDDSNSKCYFDNWSDIVFNDPNYSYYLINKNLDRFVYSYVEFPDTVVKYYQRSDLNIEDVFYTEPIPNIKLTGTLQDILNTTLYSGHQDDLTILCQKSSDKNNSSGVAYIYKHFLNTQYYDRLMKSYCNDKINCTQIPYESIVKTRYDNRDINLPIYTYLTHYKKTLQLEKKLGYSTYLVSKMINNSNQRVPSFIDLIPRINQVNDFYNNITPKLNYRIDESKLSNIQKQSVIRRGLDNKDYASILIAALRTNIRAIVINNTEMLFYPFILNDDMLISEIDSNVFMVTPKIQYSDLAVTISPSNDPTLTLNGKPKVYDFLNLLTDTQTVTTNDSNNTNTSSNSSSFIITRKTLLLIIVTIAVVTLLIFLFNKLKAM